MSLYNPARVRGTGKETAAEYILAMIHEVGPCTRNRLHKSLPIKFNTVDAGLQLLQERGHVTVKESIIPEGTSTAKVRYFVLTDKAPKATKVAPAKSTEGLKDGDKCYAAGCSNCGQRPTVFPTGLCGPCCFGEAATAGGNW